MRVDAFLVDPHRDHAAGVRTLFGLAADTGTLFALLRVCRAYRGGGYAAAVTISLCVLLWARPGEEEGLVAYEDRVLELVAEHSGRVLQRARTDGTDDQPLEIQLFTFASQAALNGYMNDERRLALAGERDRVVARTEMMRVTLT